MKRGIALILSITLLLGALAGTAIAADKKSETKAKTKPEAKVIRIGYFPNITHSQAVIGIAKGDFQKALGKDVKIDVKVFNAGPSVIEALFAGEIDVSYIGPNPAINGYVKSKGKALKVISGATSGGAVLVVRADSGIAKAKDLSGKKIASPQLGNTQDVALRYYIKKAGLKTIDNGGTVEVIPTENPNILALLTTKQIDGAWVPEPWGARLVKEAGAKIIVDERDIWPNGKFVTTHIIARTEFLKDNPKLVKKLIKAHVEETDWINRNRGEAKKILNAEIKKLTGKNLPVDVLDAAFSRLAPTYDPISSSLFVSAEHAFKLGFLGKTAPNIDKIYDLRLLNEVLKEKKKAAVKVEKPKVKKPSKKK